MALAYNPDRIGVDERCRVTLEGGYITEEVNIEYADFDNGLGGYSSMPTSRSRKIVVMNPETVWVQSIDPDKIRERITGEYPNPDAVALQVELDKMRAERDRLNSQITKMRVGYEASHALWKKRHRDEWWLTTASVEDLPDAIERGEPEPDPYDY